jgi:hypothetical protein
VLNRLTVLDQLNPPPTHPLYLVSIRSVHLYLREVQDIEDLGIDDPSGNGVISIMSESLFWKKHTEYQKFGRWAVLGSEPWLDFDEYVSFITSYSLPIIDTALSGQNDTEPQCAVPLGSRIS